MIRHVLQADLIIETLDRVSSPGQGPAGCFGAGFTMYGGYFSK